MSAIACWSAATSAPVNLLDFVRGPIQVAPADPDQRRGARPGPMAMPPGVNELSGRSRVRDHGVLAGVTAHAAGDRPARGMPGNGTELADRDQYRSDRAAGSVGD